MSESPPTLQRSRGRLDVAFAAREGVTGPQRLYQEGALKVRLPKVPAPSAPEAVIINTAGGLTGGDHIHIGVALEPAASAIITGQACEKIYKSSGGDARIDSTLTIAAGAHLEWLLQPTIVFDHGRLRRSMTVAMAADAKFLAVEAVVFGRTAMDETVSAGHVTDAWRIRRAGVLVYADGFRLDGDLGAALANPSVLAGHCAMATVIYVAPDAESRRDHMREVMEDVDGVSAASAWNGMLAARIVARDGYALTRALAQVLTRFRGAPLPRVWAL